MTKFNDGDRVRLINPEGDIEYGWPQKDTTITGIIEFYIGRVCIVNFPEYKGWHVRTNELELVLEDPSTVNTQDE